MPKQTLQVLPDIFAIHSLDANSDIPAAVLKCELYFIGKTQDELSIVVPQALTIPAIETDCDWRVLEILGPLSLSLVGIMSQIAGVLAAAKVSIFVLSTFDTDFILVKHEQLELATKALQKDGYQIKQ